MKDRKILRIGASVYLFAAAMIAVSTFCGLSYRPLNFLYAVAALAVVFYKLATGKDDGEFELAVSWLAMPFKMLKSYISGRRTSTGRSKT